jgi:hypothetical protein
MTGARRSTDSSRLTSRWIVLLGSALDDRRADRERTSRTRLCKSRARRRWVGERGRSARSRISPRSSEFAATAGFPILSPRLSASWSWRLPRCGRERAHATVGCCSSLVQPAVPVAASGNRKLQPVVASHFEGGAVRARPWTALAEDPQPSCGLASAAFVCFHRCLRPVTEPESSSLLALLTHSLQPGRDPRQPPVTIEELSGTIGTDADPADMSDRALKCATVGGVATEPSARFRPSAIGPRC